MAPPMYTVTLHGTLSQVLPKQDGKQMLQRLTHRIHLVREGRGEEAAGRPQGKSRGSSYWGWRDRGTVSGWLFEAPLTVLSSRGKKNAEENWWQPKDRVEVEKYKDKRDAKEMEEMGLNKHSWKLLDSDKDLDAKPWLSFCTDWTIPQDSFDMASIKRYGNGDVRT